MPETTERPTIRQLVDRFQNQATRQAVERFVMDAVSNGYVIVHPDDVPVKAMHDEPAFTDYDWIEGWNACRAHIFGEEA